MIYVDADACPVKEEVIRIAERHRVEVIMVADGGLRPQRHELVRNHLVPQGVDAADNWIVEQITDADICVTNDIPLARQCLEKNAVAVRPNGKVFNDDNIGMALAMREIKKHIRESGNVETRNSGFSRADRSAFLDSLHQLVLARVRS